MCSASDCRLQAVDCQNPAWCENHLFTSGSQIFHKWGCTLCPLGCIIEFSPRNNHGAQTAAALSWRALFLVRASSSRIPPGHPSGDRWAAHDVTCPPQVRWAVLERAPVCGEVLRSRVGGMGPASQCQLHRSTPLAVCAPDTWWYSKNAVFWLLSPCSGHSLFGTVHREVSGRQHRRFRPGFLLDILDSFQHSGPLCGKSPVFK